METAILIWHTMGDYIKEDWQQVKSRLTHANEHSATRLCLGLNQRWGPHLVGPMLQGDSLPPSPSSSFFIGVNYLFVPFPC